MSFLNDLSNPISPNASREDQYKFDNSVHDNLVALQYVMNPSVLSDSDFSSGGVLTTQADGDNAEFFDDWFVVGSSVADYALTPTNYAANSIIQSASPTYSHVQISNYSTTGLYFYQRQPLTVRKYQKNFLTYGLIIENNQSKQIAIEAQIFSFYDPSSSLIRRGTIYLNPGINRVTTTIKTESLSGRSVGASPYTEFRLAFIDLLDGTADLNIYQIKCEFGTVSTLLNQEI
jgi:hypothetical protein